MAKQAQLVQEQCEYVVVDLAPNTRQTVFDGPCMVYGYHVNVALSAESIIAAIEDNMSDVITLPTSAAAGFSVQLPGLYFSKLTFDGKDTATGIITIIYRTINPDFAL